MTNDHIIDIKWEAYIKCGKTREFIEDGPPELTGCFGVSAVAMPSSGGPSPGGGIGVAGSPTCTARERLEPVTPPTDT